MENETMELGTSTPELSNEATSGQGTHTVKIDGETHLVSLEELQNGYQRQADYTRKTQELGRERERLAQGEAIVQALEADPRGAITALGDAFGVSTGNQSPQVEEDLEDLDPEEVRLRRIETSIETQERAGRQQNLQKDLQKLRNKYGTDINESELYAHALRNNIGNLEAAYTHMTYESMQDRARNADIVEEKRAANVVDSTTGGSTSGNVERAVGAVSSIRDAYRLALEEANN
jgi:uncharacterized protein YerC|tara:strand:- start:2051 stop:2752 length:702 start_codon:yes stop_codon:yes gene_type:complete